MKKRVLVVLLALVMLISAPVNSFPLAVTASSSSADNVVLSQDFENSETGGWMMLPWGGTGVVSVAEDAAADNNFLHIGSRVARNSNPHLDLTSTLVPGETYDITFRVKVSEGSDTFRLVGKVDAASLTNKYPWLISNTSVSSTEWTEFSLIGYAVPLDTVEFLIWLEADGGTGGTADILIDDVLIVDVTPNAQPPADDTALPALPFNTIDFENGESSGFVPRGGNEILTITNEVNNTVGGQYALKVEGRTQTWNGPSLRVEQYLTEGHEYRISAWVRLISPNSSQLQLSTQVGSGGSASYNIIQGRTFTSAEGWVKLEGLYRYNSLGNGFVTIYIESSNNANASFYIDDIKLEPTSSGPIEVDLTLPSIKEIYEDYFMIGSAVSSNEFEGNRLSLLKHHFNVVTAENAMKPGYAYDTFPYFDFTAEDALVDRALTEGFLVAGHVLVWHQQSVDALHTAPNGDPLPREEALANLRRHVTTVVEHFGDRVISWDVVNEAIVPNSSDPSNWRGSLRQTGWYRAIGYEYIKEAFLAAKAALDGKDVKLYYNDYNEDHQNKAELIYQMVKEINETYASENDGELLIDGIGMQGHYNLNTNPENVRLSLEKFSRVTSEISITELDITAGSNFVLSEEQELAQANLYASLMKIFKENADHIERVTFWGLDDGTSWRSVQNPLLFDRNLQAKRAFDAVIDPEDFLLDHQPVERDINRGTAQYGTPVVDGQRDPVWDIASELSTGQFQTAWQGATGVARVLWDNDYLYVLINVSDTQLDKASANPWEEDSIEIFLDQNNEKTINYQEDDGQYRVNFDNETSFNPSTINEGFRSATIIEGSNYTVELKIPFTYVAPINGLEIGFDIQVNDGHNGSRQSVAAWNDIRGIGYMDTSVFGVIALAGTVTRDINLIDVPAEHWANSEIVFLTAREIMAQESDGIFEPNKSITRGELVGTIVNYYGLSSTVEPIGFIDLSASDPNYQAILTAQSLGLVKGYENGTFIPDALVSRQEFAVIIHRILTQQGKILDKPFVNQTFNDDKLIASFANKSIYALREHGFINGFPDNTFRPLSNLTKAELAVSILR